LSTFRDEPTYDELSDEELMSLLADGDFEALGPLHRRHAAMVFNISAQTLDRAAAEEICQDVFVAVWGKASTFDPERGPFRPWLLRIAHLRVLNELRRRSRRPQTVALPDGADAPALVDGSAPTDETAWRNYQRSALRAAVASLPPEQRQALSLAFFGELSHDQVAQFLDVPLGTAKSRIRAGLRRLQPRLLALALVVAVAVSAAVVVRRAGEHSSDPRLADALRLVTSSDTTALRLTTGSGSDADKHAVYRAQPGGRLAVLTLRFFDAAPAETRYVLWARTGGVWTELATPVPMRDGTGLVIIDLPPSSTLPDALEITLEPGRPGPQPTGSVVVAYPGVE
jgi:RNA polymerase sigma-70 factor (ECF subfamily)